jgi:hypothetical protein
MSHDLVAVQIEIDPAVGAATFVTAEDIAVKLTGSNEVVDGKR